MLKQTWVQQDIIYFQVFTNGEQTYLEYQSVENKEETVTSSSFITCNLKIVFKIYYFDWSCWFHITNLKFITIPSEVYMKQSSGPSRCPWRVQFKFTKYVKRLTWNKKYMDLEKLFKKRYSLSIFAYKHLEKMLLGPFPLPFSKLNINTTNGQTLLFWFGIKPTLIKSLLDTTITVKFYPTPNKIIFILIYQKPIE